VTDTGGKIEMKYELNSSRHSVHLLTYHVVWCTKYRRTVLSRLIGDRCKQLLTELCKEMELQLVAVETEVDHVHVVFKAAPTDQLSKILHRFKGVTARRLFQEFPVIKNRLWGGHLWSPSYFVVTVGGAPLEAIRKYVENQRTKGYGQKKNDKPKNK
jgi:putative transposase